MLVIDKQKLLILEQSETMIIEKTNKMVSDLKSDCNEMLELLTEKDIEISNYNKSLKNKDNIIDNLENNLLSIQVMQQKMKVYFIPQS